VPDAEDALAQVLVDVLRRKTDDMIPLAPDDRLI
jgi:hypothetical protein